jgi:N-acetylmuramoyl-L-alanine amidase
MYVKSKYFIIIFEFLSLLHILNVPLLQTEAASMKTPVIEDLEKVILIDPGHGGMDGGAISISGTLEKDINLMISLKLRNKLLAEGYEVLMTREEDKGLYRSTGPIRKMKLEDLNSRCNIKRDSNCDIFISIHQNYFPERKYYGSQVWYSKSEDSKRLAQILQKSFRDDLENGNKREEKPAGNDYKILRCYCSIPSVIVECGFLSNTKEEIQLKDENYQELIADSIVKSINEYFK